MTHIFVGKLTIIGSDNGLSPDRRQAIIWTNAGILLIRTLGTNGICVDMSSIPKFLDISTQIVVDKAQVPSEDHIEDL